MFAYTATVNIDNKHLRTSRSLMQIQTPKRYNNASTSRANQWTVNISDRAESGISTLCYLIIMR